MRSCALSNICLIGFHSQGVANLPLHAGTIMWVPYCGQALWIPWLTQIATCGTMTRASYATIVMLVRLVYLGTSEKNGGKQTSFWLWPWLSSFGSMSLLVVPSRMPKQKTSSAVTNRVGFDPLIPSQHALPKSFFLCLLVIFLSRPCNSVVVFVFSVHILLFCFLFWRMESQVL